MRKFVLVPEDKYLRLQHHIEQNSSLPRTTEFGSSTLALKKEDKDSSSLIPQDRKNNQNISKKEEEEEETALQESDVQSKRIKLQPSTTSTNNFIDSSTPNPLKTKSVVSSPIPPPGEPEDF